MLTDVLNILSYWRHPHRYAEYAYDREPVPFPGSSWRPDGYPGVSEMAFDAHI